MASPDSKCKVSLKGTLQCKVVNSLIHGFIQSGQDEFLSFKQLCIVMMNRTELLSYEHCACFYGQFHQLIIIYYTDILARVKILHVRQSQSRYVSHLQIQHMVYTDTGDKFILDFLFKKGVKLYIFIIIWRQMYYFFLISCFALACKIMKMLIIGDLCSNKVNILIVHHLMQAPTCAALMIVKT